MATPVLAATPMGSRRSVVLLLTNDIGSKINLYRVVAGGRTLVRGAENLTAVSGQTIFVDYELPQNTPISYVATTTVTTVVSTSNTVVVGSVDFGGDVIFDLGTPWSGMQVYVESFASAQYAISQETLSVWDRPDPVVVSGVRQLPAGKLVLITLTLAARASLLDIIRSGNVVGFLQWQPSYGLDPVTYFSVGSVNEVRVSKFATEPTRRWELDVQQVSMPPAAKMYPTGTVTWLTVKNANWAAYLPKQWYEVAGL